MPSNLLFIDVETVPVNETETYIEHDFKIGCWQFMYQHTIKQNYTVQEGFYKDKAEYVDSIINKITSKRPMVLISSNIYFDLHNSGLLRYFIDQKWKWRAPFSKGFTQLFSFGKGNKKVKAYNLQQFLPYSIERLGKLLGIEKLKIDFDNCTEEELRIYCMRDVEISRLGFLKWLEFIKVNDLGNFAKTLPGQAFNAYRHRFMKKDIFIHHEPNATALERASYYGGRTEAFFIGNIRQRVFKLDVNSMYPAVMKENAYPVWLNGIQENIGTMQLKMLCRKYAVCAEVDIETDHRYYPMKLDNRLMFPVGKFTTTLCTESLSRALQYGHIVKVHKAAYYRKERIFQEYVDYFVGLKNRYKKEDNAVFYWVTKIMLNSLYGKFGQCQSIIVNEGKGSEYKVGCMRNYNMKTHKWTETIYHGWTWQEVDSRGEEAYNAFPAISAHVTDYARWMLHDLIEKGEWDNVLYMDTDSLFVTFPGYIRLVPYIDEYRLGALKVEGEAMNMEIKGLKDYDFDDETHIKGISKRAQKLNEDTYTQIQFPGFKSGLREHFKGLYKILKVTKHLSRKYKKGKVQETGEVLPWRLEQ